MFNWYSNSDICFAYLADVSEVEISRTSTNDEFSKSRWFTRGWTLQELIAPRNVEFFTNDWSLIAKKTDKFFCDTPEKLFRVKLSSITGIHRKILEDSSEMDTISIDERMSWISHRDTTREEDMAYCLMGIFDVNMPILYGEGRHKAMDRLHVLADITRPRKCYSWVATYHYGVEVSEKGQSNNKVQNDKMRRVWYDHFSRQFKIGGFVHWFIHRV